HLLQALAALALAMVSHHHVEIGIVARTASRKTNSHHSSGRGLVSVRATEKSAGFYADQGFGANPLPDGGRRAAGPPRRSAVPCRKAKPAAPGRTSASARGGHAGAAAGLLKLQAGLAQ